jgi:hypothetical protein
VFGHPRLDVQHRGAVDCVQTADMNSQPGDGLAWRRLTPMRLGRWL